MRNPAYEDVTLSHLLPSFDEDINREFEGDSEFDSTKDGFTKLSDIRLKIINFKRKLPLLFEDNNVLLNQIRVYFEQDSTNGQNTNVDPEYGGIWQIDETQFAKTQNRREKLFQKLYDALYDKFKLDWNTVLYGSLKTSRRDSLVAALLNVQANYFESKGPGVSAYDQCNYIINYVVDKRNQISNINDCEESLKSLPEDEAIHGITGTEATNRFCYQDHLTIIDIPLNDLSSKRTNHFDISVTLSLHDHSISIEDSLDEPPQLQHDSSMRSYVSLTKNCLEPDELKFLTDFSYEDSFYYDYDSDLREITISAAYDLVNDKSAVKRPSLCVYTVSDDSNKNGCLKDLEIRTQFSRLDDENLDGLDFLVKRYKYPKTVAKTKSQGFENYNIWRETVGTRTFNMTWLGTNTADYNQYTTHNGSATTEQIASDFRKISNNLQMSTEKVLPKEAIIGMSAGSASLVILIAIVVGLWIYIKKLSEQKEETPKETIYTMVREAPQNLQRVKGSISTRFTRGTKRQEQKPQKKKTENPGLPAGWA